MWRLGEFRTLLAGPSAAVSESETCRLVDFHSCSPHVEQGFFLSAVVAVAVGGVIGLPSPYLSNVSDRGQDLNDLQVEYLCRGGKREVKQQHCAVRLVETSTNL